MFPPTSQHPADAAVVPGDVTLSWKPAVTRGLAAPEYECRIEENKAGRWVDLAVHASLKETTLDVEGLRPGSRFRWQVIARSGRIEARSEPRTFQTEKGGER